MKNFWVAILSVLCITFFTGTASATAPVAQDIPDFKLLTGSGQVDSFDLDDYVTDYDDGPDGLTWTISGTSGFDSGANTPAYSVTDPLADIGGSAVVTQGVFTFRVADASEYSEDSSVVKYSSLLMAQPGLTQDNNLNPPNTFTRTLIVQTDATLTTPELSQLISPQSASDADLYVSIADLDGNWLAGDNATSAQYGELLASISGSGELVLQAAPGSTGMNQLSGAYRVGVKAKKTGGVGENWDGSEFLVSHSRFPTRDFQNTAARLDKFNNFEGLAVGPLATTAVAMRAVESGWYKPLGTGTADVVASAPTDGSSAWASSGQALKIGVTAGQTVYCLSEFFTDIQAGETVTFSANVTTDLAAGATSTGGLTMFVGNMHINSNNAGVVYQSGTASGAPELPTGGVAGWRTIKATMTADANGAAVADGTETVNFYERGYQCNLIVTGAAASFNLYVDNVRVYRSKQDVDLAFGNTVASVAGLNDYADDLFDGTFEGGTTLETLTPVWERHPVARQGTSQINTDPVNNMFTHDGSNSLEMFVPGNGRTGNLTEFAFTRLGLNATAAGEANYVGSGIYGLSLWYKTNAGAIKDLPGVLIALTDPQFRNTAFNECGYVAAPLGGTGWKQAYCSSARALEADKLWPFVVVGAPILWATDGAHIRPYWGSYGVLGANPGYEADAHVFVDDVKIHKMMDDAMYFDRSVFPAAD